MTPTEAIEALPAKWQEFTQSPEFAEKMRLAQEIAVLDAESIDLIRWT